MAADQLMLAARNVRRLRSESGYSQSELARRAGLAKQTLSSIEAGDANPTVVTLAAIAEALGIPLSYLLTEYGSAVLVKRVDEATWAPSAEGEVRDLGRVYGSGYVRTALIRYRKTGDAPLVHPRHRPGTLHHAYVVTGRLATGPAGEEIAVSRGDFVRFPGDVPHATSVWAEPAVVHMVTTIPQVSQISLRAC